MTKKATKTDNNSAQALISGDAIPGMKSYDPSTLSERVSTALAGGARIQTTVSLDAPGKGIAGVLVGRGPSVDFTDVDGEVRDLSTWQFDVGGGLLVNVISAAQLEKKLVDLVGQNIEVIRGAQRDTKKGRRVNDFVIIELDPEE